MMGNSRAVTVLLAIVLVLVVAVLAVLGTVMYVALQTEDVPRSAAERDVLIAQDAVHSDPSSAERWAALALAYARSNQWSDHDSALDAARTVDSSHPSIGYVEGIAAQLQGNMEEAEEILAATMASSRDYYERVREDQESRGITAPVREAYVIESGIALARIYVDQGRLEDAYRTFTEVLDEDSTMADVLAERGDVAAQLDRLDDAREDYEAALRLVPGYPQALEGLEGLEE
jgi:tetratricopeptide (TPR) repeat protein